MDFAVAKRLSEFSAEKNTDPLVKEKAKTRAENIFEKFAYLFSIIFL
jgi:hypothetical protein